MKDALLVIALVVGAFSFFFVLGVLKTFLADIFRRMNDRGFPLERRLHLWLQDRAAARAMGVDIGILRARRKIDFGDDH